MSDDFVRDLEEELVAAARFRAHRRSRRFVLPRLPRRRAVGGALAGAALAALAIAAVLTLTRGDHDRAADERRVTPPPSGFVVPLAPMLPGYSCGERDVREQPAAPAMPDFAVLARQQHEDDGLIEEVGASLPVGTFDRTEVRLAGDRRLRTRLHVVPSMAVPDDASCVAEGPGLCLVIELGTWYRCFRLTDVRGGRALARTPEGRIVGVVPDGIERVGLEAAGRTAAAVVVDNVYEAELDVPSGTPVRVRIAGRGDCTRTVAPELLERVATLRREPDVGFGMPQAAVDVLGEWKWQLDAIVEDGARFWGGGEDVEYWAVPVVKQGSPDCAPARHVCVVAVVVDAARADAQCNLGRAVPGWRLAPLLPDHAVIYGTVPDGVTGARVTIGDRTDEVDAGDNVTGGVLPFPYRDGARTHVELIRRAGVRLPTVGVVDAGGPARAVVTSLREQGYETLDAITPGVKDQPRTDVYFRPGRTSGEAALAVAEALAAVEATVIPTVTVIPTDDAERVPRPVQVTDADVVVVVGGG
jgi:hypothetical protein